MKARPVGVLEHAVVLTGGDSSRMGRSKALLPLGEETLVSRLVRGLGGLFDSVALSSAVGDETLASLAGISSNYPDRERGRGPLEGVRASLYAMPVDFAFFIAVDIPLIWAPLVRRLALCAVEAGGGAMARFQGRFEPGFAVYGQALLGHIDAVVERGERRLQAMAEWPEVSVLDLDDSSVLDGIVATGESHSAPGELFWNVNTPEDYDRLVEAFNAGRITADSVIF